MQNEIGPTLKKLKDQQEQYTSFLENKRLLEKLEKFRLAHYYSECLEILKGSEEELKTYKTKIVALEGHMKEHQSGLKDAKENIEQLTELKEKEMSIEVHELEEKVDSSSKFLVKHDTAYQHLVKSSEEEQNKLKELNQALENMQKRIHDKRTQLDEQTTLFNEKETLCSTCKDQLENLKRQYQVFIRHHHHQLIL